MSKSTTKRSSRVLSDDSESLEDILIFPDEIGTVVVYLDKEALLARLTSDHRSQRKEAVVDRFFDLSRERAYYVTDVYVVAEIVSAFRSSRGASEAVALYEDVKRSDLIVQHGADPWEADELSASPQAVMDAAAEFITRYPKHDVSLQEAVLVMQALRGDDVLFSFDGPIRQLARSCDVTVYPVTTGVYRS